MQSKTRNKLLIAETEDVLYESYAVEGRVESHATAVDEANAKVLQFLRLLGMLDSYSPRHVVDYFFW